MSTRNRASNRGRAGARVSAPRGVRTASATEVRARYTKRLDEMVKTMVEAYKSIIEGAAISDRASNAQGELRGQVETAKLTTAAESILKLTSELKIALIAQNVGESYKEDCAYRDTLGSGSKKCKDELVKLRDNVSTMLTRLESHYYKSVPHVRVHQALLNKASNINNNSIPATLPHPQ